MEHENREFVDIILGTFNTNAFLIFGYMYNSLLGHSKTKILDFEETRHTSRFMETNPRKEVSLASG